MQLAIFFDNDLIYLGFEAKQAQINLFLDNKPIALGSDAGQILSKFNFGQRPNCYEGKRDHLRKHFKVCDSSNTLEYSLRNHETILYLYIFLTFFKKIQIEIIAPSINL